MVVRRNEYKTDERRFSVYHKSGISFESEKDTFLEDETYTHWMRTGVVP